MLTFADWLCPPPIAHDPASPDLIPKRQHVPFLAGVNGFGLAASLVTACSAAATTQLLPPTVQPVVGSVDDADVPVGRGGQGRAGVAQFGWFDLCVSKKNTAHSIQSIQS